jgi:hypothetical protein
VHIPSLRHLWPDMTIDCFTTTESVPYSNKRTLR